MTVSQSTRIPPLGALYLEMYTNWSSPYVWDSNLTFGCIVLMVICIGHIDQTIHGWIQSSVDLMKKGKELHCISQQTQKEYMLPTEMERNSSWEQLTSWICTGWCDLQNSLQIAPVPLCSKWASSLVCGSYRRVQQLCGDTAAASHELILAAVSLQ